MKTMPTVESLARARRVCAIGIILAATAAVALIAIALLAALDVLLPFPRAFRLAIAVGGALTLITWIALRWRKASLEHTNETAAQAMEAARPELGQQLRTALEITQRGVPQNATPEAKLFAARLVDQAKASLNRFSWNSLIPRGRRALWVTAVIAIVGLIGFGAARSADFRLGLARVVAPAIAGTYTELGWTVAPNVFDDRHPPRFEVRVDRRLAEPALFVRERGGEWVKTGMTPLPDGRSWDVVLTGRASDLELYATAGDARTLVHNVVFKPLPKLVASRVHLTYPEYTGLPPATREQGDVSVVEETRVKWEFAFNVMPERVEWQFGTEAPRAIPVDPATKTAASDWTAGTGKFNAVVSVLDGSGQAIDSWRYVAEGFADALPTVEVLEPGKDHEATSVTELPVRIRAKDDFGVSEVGLVLEAAGQRDWVLEQVITERDQRKVTEIATAMLEKVPLTIRDNVRFFAYALDHKPRGGARAVSALRSIDIREFKKRWAYREGGGGGAGRQKISDGIMKLGKIISTQREIVSDTFLLRENTRSSSVAVTSEAAPIGMREAELSTKAGELREKWLDEGGFPPDDVTLLDTAGAQMFEAASSLGLRGPANVEKGFAGTDRALTTLLQLRKKLLTLLSNCACDSDEPPKPEDQIRPLADLAKEAERLAREERDVRSQLAPEVAAGTNLEATRQQHETAVSDGGELYAAVVDHPQANDAIIRFMDAAEKAQRAADEALHKPEAQAAAPQLEAAEQRFLEAAEFLRAMELSLVAETLKKMGDQAEKAGQAMRDSSKDQASKDPAGKDQAGKEKGSSPGNAARQASQGASMADQILGSLAEKAGGKGKTADREEAGAEQSLGETLSELREQAGAAKLADELGKLADSQQGSGADSAESKAAAENSAGELDAMAGKFRDTARRLEANRAAKLAAAQAQAKELQKQLAAKQAEGQKPGDKPGQGKGDKPGGAGGKKGDKPDDQGLAKGDKPGKAGPGDKPKDGKQDGRGGIAGDTEIAKNSRGGQAMGRFSMSLRGIGDDRLNEFSIKLFNAPFSRDSIPLVEEAAQRIDELIAALPGGSAPIASLGRVPESRRREVEDYFRDLSDDFSGENWDAEPAPGQRAQ